MAWRLAKSLETLRNQVNAAYPNRSKASDGTIGDAAHASRPSDHNPNAAGVVTALDITHNPPYFDAHALANTLIANRHSNLKYVISNNRIAGAWTGWKWQSYSGTNPHTKHIHVSVGVGNDGQGQPPYDSTTPWVIKTTPQGGANVFNTIEEVKEAYIQMRGVVGTDAEMRPWIGQSKQRWIQLSTAETSSTRQQLADVRKALANLQAQPPKEVIKEVVKIVEKPVEVIKTIETVKEVEPTWLTAAVNFVRKVLRIKE